MSIAVNAEIIRDKFYKLYHEKPAVLISSPGRVNLLGEHTDYNEGFVLPAAIDKRMFFAIALRGDRRCRLHAHDLGENFEFHLNELHRVELPWPNYLIGVAAQLQNAGYALQGFVCVFGGDIPIGAGLSSSAALECGLAFGLNHLLDLGIEPLQLIRYAQKAEHEFAGVQCGIMDQFANMFGKKSQVVRLDCRSMEYQYFPFDMTGYRIVLCDTKVRRSLAGSEYNKRREQCNRGVALLKEYFSEILSLRDVTAEMLEKHRHELDTIVYKRCKYVVEENRRVIEGCNDLSAGKLPAFGEKMYRTHEGLQHEYEVSCKELDFLVDLTRDDPAVLGARMMGGGFGGCTINLVKADAVEMFGKRIDREYEREFGKEPVIYVTQLSGGTGLLEDEG